MLHFESQGGNQVLWCHLISHWGSCPVPLNSSLLFLDCHKETTWLQHFESEFKMTRQLKKLLCIFLMTRKINVVQSISHIHGGKTGTMRLREKQLQEIISPRGRRHRHRAVLPSPNTPLTFSTEGKSLLFHRGVTALLTCTIVVCQTKVHNCLTFGNLSNCFLFQPHRSDLFRERESVLWAGVDKYLGLIALNCTLKFLLHH